MIIYFADRHMKVLGQASTGLPSGFSIRKDEKIEETDTGVASFSCYITFEDKDRLTVEAMTDAGNYLLRKNDDENEFYTIIDSEVDPESHEVYIYAEDAGLDLLNEIADPYEATEAHPIAWYIEKWTEDSGFEIGINEVSDLSRKLKWEGESTVTERLASVATQFDNAEISYSFDIDGLIITNKYVNIHKKRGKDIGDELRTNKHLNNIIVKKSVANLATALRVTGGTPEGQEDPITLKGYSYDDGDFYVDSNGTLKSRKAVERWSRYCWEKKIPGYEGHIEKTYSYDTTNKQTLCAHAVTELKSICEMEVNYEADIAILPDTVKIGDRVNIVDDNGELYVSARLLQLKTSIVEGTRKALFGEYLIKDSGISDKVEALAAQFAEIAKTRVFYTWIAYADDSVGTGISLEPVGKAYMGISSNRTSETPDITDPTVYKWSKIQGDKGDIGLSLVSVTEYYLLSNLTEGVTVNTPGWSTDIPTMSPDNKYLWNYEVFTYSDGSTETMDPKIIGAYGETGAAGDPAPAIVTMTEEYYLSTSKTQLAGGEWVRTMPEWETGKYLWTRWCIEWSEPNPTTLTYSDPVVATSFNEIHEAADSAKTAAEEAKTEAENATSQVSQVNTELAQAQQELEALAGNLETLESDMSTNYATKGELTQVNTSLGTQIQQNAAQISSTASAVQQVDIDATQALQDAASAAAAAAQAQQNATDAQNKYTALKQQADVTDEQLAVAKEAVEEAQKAATEAGDAAAAAQSAADSLADRVTTAESNITQMATQISQTVQKVENIKVGGRNLLKNSESIVLSGTNYSSAVELNEGLITIIAESGAFNAYKYPETTIPVEELTAEVGTQYVFSGEIKMTGLTEQTNLVFDFRSEDEATKNRVSASIPLDKEGEWQTVSGILTVANTGLTKCVIIISGSQSVKDATIEYRHFKLERGNKATDWSPAPEDLASVADVDHITSEELVDIRQSITNINQTFEDIELSVSDIETKQNAMDELKSQIEQITSVLIEDGKISFDFETIKEQVNDAVEELERRNRYVAITEDATLGATITIGDSESGMVGRFTKTSLDFLSGDTVIASYANDGLTTENITTNNQLKFGSNWAIRPGAGGNLNDVWIGG